MRQRSGIVQEQPSSPGPWAVPTKHLKAIALLSTAILVATFVLYFEAAMRTLTLTALAVLGVAAQKEEPNIYTASKTDPVYDAQATAPTITKTSHVRGKAFDRFVTIWLENTDYQKAAGDPNLQWFAAQGITLFNYFAVTHPSEPNYVASHGGDNFGMDNDNLYG